MTEPEPSVEEMWRTAFGGKIDQSTRLRRLLMGALPADPRCKLCKVPFAGVGGAYARRVLGKRPWNKNPHYCDACAEFAQKYRAAPRST